MKTGYRAAVLCLMFDCSVLRSASNGRGSKGHGVGRRSGPRHAALALLGVVACQKHDPKPGAAVGPDRAVTAADAPLRPDPVTPAQTAVPAPATRPAAPLNVILLTVDALRADMPWSGYSRQIAPNLSALAATSAVWENHRSVASYTAQTVATLLSGRYASTLYRDGWFFTGYSEQNLFFTEALQARGIRTIGLHAHMYFGKDKGLSQGFDIWETVPGISFDAQTDNHITSPKSTARLIELLSEPANTDKQFFVWSHYMDPHDKYIAHEESPDFGPKNRDRYDSEVFFTDLWLGKFFEFAQKQPWWERTAVIITGDHGEAFGEHGMYKHAFELWDVLLRVPLIIRVPGAQPVVIKQGRTHIDLAPTIVDLMGLAAPAQLVDQMSGHSLVPEIYGAPAAERRPVLLELAEDSHNPGLRAIVEGDHKLIVHTRGGGVRLFNLRDDPGELENLAKRMPEKRDEMLALFKESFAQVPSIEPHGGMKLQSGRRARGPAGPSEKP